MPGMSTGSRTVCHEGQIVPEMRISQELYELRESLRKSFSEQGLHEVTAHVRQTGQTQFLVLGGGVKPPQKNDFIRIVSSHSAAGKISFSLSNRRNSQGMYILSPGPA